MQHIHLSVGYDFNHESAATKDLVDRVIEHWLTKYKIDGFRWDFSKGFTQNFGTDKYGLYGVNMMQAVLQMESAIYDKMQAMQVRELLYIGAFC